MKISESHSNGSEIQVSGLPWQVVPVLNAWRAYNKDIKPENKKRRPSGFQPNDVVDTESETEID